MRPSFAGDRMFEKPSDFAEARVIEKKSRVHRKMKVEETRSFERVLAILKSTEFSGFESRKYLEK